MAQLLKYHPHRPIYIVGDFNRHKAMDMPSPVKWVPVEGIRGVPNDHMYARTDVNHSKVKRRYKWGSDHYTYKMTTTF